MRVAFFKIAFILCAFDGMSQFASESRAIYTRKEGLSNNTVTSIVKDNRGFLWIGTTEGLNRFDGRHFRTFYSDTGDSSNLSGNNLYDIIQYQPGMLLIATNNGVSVFNTVTNRFENDRIQVSALRKGSGIYVRSLFKDEQGHVYINYSGKIDVFDQDLRFLYCLTDTKWGRSVRGIDITFEKWVQDSKGQIWIPSDNMGICILDGKKKQVYSFANNPRNYPFLRIAPVRSFFYDEAKQQVFVSFWGEGLAKFNLLTGTKTTQDFNTKAFGEARCINAITLQNNRLICCGTFCIYSVDPETFLYTKMFQNSSDPATAFIDCYTVLNDSENIWVGTESRGLLQIPNQTSKLYQVGLPYSVRDFTSGCTGIQQVSKDIIYLAYGEDGLIELNQHNFHAMRYPVPSTGRALSYISKILQYDSTQLLVGTMAGLYFFDTKTKKYHRTDLFPSTTDELPITAIAKDNEGNCWFASRLPNALSYYERKSNSYFQYPNYLVNNQQVFNPGVIITRMSKDQEGNIWLSSAKSNGGMSRLHAATGKWTQFGNGNHAAGVFKGRELGTLYVRDTVIWAANAYGMGLIRYDYGKDSVQHIGRKDGLLSENIFSITSDYKKNLFISTQSGISYYNMVSGEARTLMIEDGDIDWSSVYAQFFDTLNNRLVYALNDRILIASEKLWEKPTSDSVKVFIDEISVNNEPVILKDQPMTLSHNQRNISIQFIAINYSRNSDLQYAYKMQGIDKS